MAHRKIWTAVFLGLLLAVSAFPSAKAQEHPILPRVEVKARIFPGKHLVTGEVAIFLPAGKGIRLMTPSRVKTQGPRGRNRYFGPYREPKRLLFPFTALFQDPSWGSYIGPQGVVLPDAWFPQPQGMAFYKLSVTLPPGLVPVTSMDSFTHKRGKATETYTFHFPYPARTMPLVAAPYRVFRAKAQGITMAVYLLEKDEDLAQKYLVAMARYVKYYNNLIGVYPYRRLAAVVNPIVETGYAFPTFTLLGRHVIRLPFILNTSLPHEILHNWFGNGVYVKGGNWCEGLVSYLADEGMAEKRGEGWRYRHRILVNYQAYVTPDRDFPLIRFQGRYDPASQAVGYGKGSMVFHMLRKRLGDEAFFTAIRDLYKDYLFREAGWGEIERLMEKASHEDLESFFYPWLHERGVPRLKAVVRTAKARKGEDYVVHITMRQEGPVFPIQIPVVIKGTRGYKRLTLVMKGPQLEKDVKVDGKPREVLIDPDYDVMRHLSPREYPPLLARVMGRGGYLVGGDSPVYTPLKAFFTQKGYKKVDPRLILPGETRKNLVFLGEPPRGFPYLFHPPPKGSSLYLEVQENPLDQETTVTWVVSSSPEETQRLLPKLPHLGAYQVLAISGGRMVKMEKPGFKRGMVLPMGQRPQGIDLKGLLTLDQVARGVSPKRVIFLGEEHPQYGQHLAQRDIIRWLVNHGHRVAIGMEAFQRPYQKVIDQYLAGKINLAQFLKGTEYYSRWGYDYKLYKPIIDYAKAHHLPIVALNIPKEITRKVARKGLKSLTPKEKKEIPQDLDFSNESYRQYLKKVYEAHGHSLKDVKDFETFYQSQILWDEGMAQSIAHYMKEHPDTQMVVIVGKGHVAYGYGIPSRVERRGIKPCAIVILGNDQELDPNLGDYLLVPPYVKPPFSARIGVVIQEEKGKGLLVKMVVPNTPAQRGGLKKGDIIVEADGKPVRGIEDLKAVLMGKRPQDTVKVVVLRDRKRLTFTLGPFRKKAPSRESKGKSHGSPKMKKPAR